VNWFTGIVTYLIIWWVVLFAVLPWGVRQQQEVEPGHDPGAPANPQLLRKAVATSVIAAVLWLIAYFIVDAGLLNFRQP
jgi:predicted secreted protein